MAAHLEHQYDEAEVKAIAEQYNISEGQARQKIYQRKYNEQYRTEHRQERIRYLREYRERRERNGGRCLLKSCKEV